MDRVVHLYTDRGPFSIVLTLVKLGMALAGLYIIAREAMAGRATQVLWTGVAMAGGGGFFGIIDLTQMLDRQPQVTLSAEGLLDHRRSPARVMPWSAITGLGYRGGGDSTGWSLELQRAGDRPVLLEGTYLRIRPRELVRLIQDFAPHVAVDPRFRLWIG
ncbi:hypothetical protein [Devosia aquimaris]|uniref:hypothetical protein n=1 Tax=Devosia aquimaris TaxID=2866214 RepID=UPI001CD09F9F|nr:hypothetical protein [Devosia sp. CJK-A8-3]